MSGFCPGCNSSECRGEAFHYREHAERWQRISERQHDEIQRLNRALEGATRGAEKLRQQRHHEFFLRAFSMFGQGLCDRYQHDDSGPELDSMLGQVRLARRVADEAYPPPKDDGFRMNAGSIAEAERGAVIARNNPPSKREPSE